MRIISGKLRGRKIFFPNDKTTRPLRDLVKESIFNLIAHSKKLNFEIKNTKVLDLFAGSGSFGLECVSRGSKIVIFNEIYFKALETLNENISNLKIDNQCKVIEKNIFHQNEYLKYFGNEFDIIFLDPPYKEKNINHLIEKIVDLHMLKKNGIIILHRHKKDNIEVSKKLNVLEKRFYGISKIIIGN